MIYDVIVIGLGAAGVSASIYAKRSGLNLAVINFSTPGGIINESSIVENYPGFTCISGSELAFKYFEHFNSLNIPLYNEEVLDIKYDEIKTVITNKHEFKSENVIICSGRKPKKLGLKNENKYIGNGISFCSVCDGNLYKKKDVAVIGGGNSALEGALYLSNICNKVYMLVRKNKFVGNELLINEVNNKKNIIVCYEEYIDDFIDENNKLAGIKTNKEIIKLSGLFVHIGFEPSINILKSLDLKMDNNYIIVNENMETSMKGIYACGDIIKKDLYQLVTAISDGAIAANHIFKTK